MITIVYNETLKAIDVLMDAKGADLLIETLQKLKTRGDHLHLYGTNDDGGLSLKSPYKHEVVYGELVLGLLPSEAWDNL